MTNFAKMLNFDIYQITHTVLIDPDLTLDLTSVLRKDRGSMARIIYKYNKYIQKFFDYSY